MSRLDIFNVKLEELYKHNIEMDYTMGLEFPTEYDKLVALREAKIKGNIHSCKDCENLSFNFDQNTYTINYFCQLNQEKKISLEDIEKLIVCKKYKKNITEEVNGKK